MKEQKLRAEAHKLKADLMKNKVKEHQKILEQVRTRSSWDQKNTVNTRHLFDHHLLSTYQLSLQIRFTDLVGSFCVLHQHLSFRLVDSPFL